MLRQFFDVLFAKFLMNQARFEATFHRIRNVFNCRQSSLLNVFLRNYFMLFSFQKYAVKSVDRIIQRDVPVKCLQKDCIWIGSLQDYDEVISLLT